MKDTLDNWFSVKLQQVLLFFKHYMQNTIYCEARVGQSKSKGIILDFYLFRDVSSLSVFLRHT